MYNGSAIPCIVKYVNKNITTVANSANAVVIIVPPYVFAGGFLGAARFLGAGLDLHSTAIKY